MAARQEAVRSGTLATLLLLCPDETDLCAAREGYAGQPGVEWETLVCEQATPEALDAVIRESSGEFIAILLPGDRLWRGALEKHLWALKLHPDRNIAYSPLCALVAGLARRLGTPLLSLASVGPHGRLDARATFRRERYAGIESLGTSASLQGLVWACWLGVAGPHFRAIQVLEPFVCRSDAEDTGLVPITPRESRRVRLHNGLPYLCVGQWRRLMRVAGWLDALIHGRAPRWLSGPWGHMKDKLVIEGLLDPEMWFMRPTELVLRLLPRRLKGRAWQSLQLPYVHTEPWRVVPEFHESIDTQPPSQVIAASARRTGVLILHPWMVVGGAEQVLIQLFGNIDRTRFNVRLVTTESSPDPWRDRFEAVAEEVAVLPSFLPREHYLDYLVHYVDSRAIDIVMVSLDTYGYTAAAPLRQARPHLRFLDLQHAEHADTEWHGFRISSLFREHLDKRVVITETVKQALLERYDETADRIAVIPNGIDASVTFNPQCHERGVVRAELGIPESARLIVYFGRFSVEKQPLQVVEVTRLLADVPDVHFVMFGSGALEAEMRAYAEEHRVANLTIAGFRSDVPSVLADAYLTLFPSRREGLPMSGIESLAMGIPVIASRVPGWIDLIASGETGILVDDGDIEGYARAIRSLLDDTDAYQWMSVKAREKAIQHYDAKVTTRQWERLFSELVSRQ